MRRLAGAARAAALAATLAAGPLAGPAAADDDRAGYYYPAVTSSEIFARDVGAPPPASRAVRVNFITELSREQDEARHPPRFVIFAKGAEAEHMIIVALDDEVFRTLYRARAVLADLTAEARATDFFKRNQAQFTATWFDLAKFLGFQDIVISDGITWAHRVVLR